MDDDRDERTPEQIVYTLGRVHTELNPNVAKLATTFEAVPYPWMAPWEREAWQTLSDAEAWRWYRLGVDAGAVEQRVRTIPKKGGRRRGKK